MNSSEPLELPSHLVSDYIEMGYLSLVILVGIPSNVFVLNRLFTELKKTPVNSVKGGFLLLKINLNISDLLLLFTAFGKFVWLYTYEWTFGDSLCRVYQYLAMFSLYLSSNVVVCIAIDRLRNVLHANRLYRSYQLFNPVTLIITLSWLAALIFSLPQFFVFETINLAPDSSEGWYQCSDIWQIYVNSKGPYSPIIMSEYVQDFYNISHLIVVFWGPLLVLMGSYIIIATRLMQYTHQGVTGQEAVRRPSNEPTQMDMGEENSTIITTTTRATLVDKTSSWKFWNQNRPQPLLEAGERLDVPTPRKKSSTSSAVPSWRKQLRSKVFKTTLLVVAVHFLFWFPYNALSLMKYINEPLYRNLSDHANIFKDMQILITLINPFIYGF